MAKGDQTVNQRSEQRTTPYDAVNPALNNTIGALTGLSENLGLSGLENSAISQLRASALNPVTHGPAAQALATDLQGGGIDRRPMVSGALDDFNARTRAGFDQFAGSMPGYLNDYRTSMGSALDTARASLTPMATGSTNPYDNADFQAMMDNTTSNVMDRVKSAYGGAGISAANYGDFGQSAGRGIAEATAPVAWQAANDLANRRMAAGNALYGIESGGAGGILGAGQGTARNLYDAANTTAGGLNQAATQGAGILGQMDQTNLANREAGLNMAERARSIQNIPLFEQLAAEQMAFDIPANRIAKAETLAMAPAQAFGTTTQNSTTTKSGGGNPLGQVLGAGLGLAGLAMGNPMGAAGLFGGLGGMGGMFGQQMINPGVAGGGYYGAGGNLYAGPGWYK